MIPQDVDAAHSSRFDARRESRNRSIRVRCSDSELEAIDAAARSSGCASRSDWIRRASTAMGLRFALEDKRK